nr:hypothetical protein GCM10020185_51830 [Pseudomonas brassicacearum subsp. brassicacearum]
MRWIEQRIEAASNDMFKLPLHDRRKDLKPLSVDFNAVHRSVSSVDIIVPVLERFIDMAPEALEQAMIEARYPNGLPYFQHWVTVDTVARHHGLSVGSFVQSVSPSFPYFFQAQAWYNDAGPALAHASRLGPYQRRLLTEEAAKLADRDVFYAHNFGTDDLTWQDLEEMPFFGERTKLDTRGARGLAVGTRLCASAFGQCDLLVANGVRRAGKRALGVGLSQRQRPPGCQYCG